jgi:hypothetical protein
MFRVALDSMFVGVGNGAHALHASLPRRAIDRAQHSNLSPYRVRRGPKALSGTISKTVPKPPPRSLPVQSNRRAIVVCRPTGDFVVSHCGRGTKHLFRGTTHQRARQGQTAGDSLPGAVWRDLSCMLRNSTEASKQIKLFAQRAELRLLRPQAGNNCAGYSDVRDRGRVCPLHPTLQFASDATQLSDSAEYDFCSPSLLVASWRRIHASKS